MDLIPAPFAVEHPADPVPADAARFRLTADTGLSGGPGTDTVERLLRSALGAATGFALRPGAPGLELTLSAELAPEEYLLEATPERVSVTGGSEAGLFWGAQTLRQLLGPEAYRRAPVRRAEWTVPAVTVGDAPRFGWRGVHARRVPALPAQGRRAALPRPAGRAQAQRAAPAPHRRPGLAGRDQALPEADRGRRAGAAEVGYRGGLREPGSTGTERPNDTPHGGFYTQDDLREIVAYAAERQITVVPEIDIPGHAQAAIAAYPELGNTDVQDTSALKTWTDWGINPTVLNVEDSTLRFYEQVLEEVLEIFPSTFVHLGGDECPKEQWKASPAAQARIKELGLADEDELQSWFIRHFDSWLAARGRRLIGWDEILEGGLAEGAAVASWRGLRGRGDRRQGRPRRGHVSGAACLPGPPAGGRVPTSRSRSAGSAPWRTSTGSSRCPRRCAPTRRRRPM